MLRINGENGGNGGIKPAISQGNDPVSRNLQNQIENAQKQLQELSKNQDMSSEEKMKKRQELNQQINELTSQLKQHQAEVQRERRAESSASSNQERTETAKSHDGDTAEFSQEGMQAVLSANSSLKLAKVQARVKKEIQGCASVLETEIKQDNGRGASVEAKQESLSKLEQKMSDIENSQMGALGEVNQTLHEGRENVQQKDTEEFSKREEKTDETNSADNRNFDKTNT